jgi:uncharacterized protein (TIGR02145 family)
MNKIRKYIIILCLFITGITCYSQAPNLISYQTVIRNGNNELVSNTTVGVRINILGGPEANVLVYQEEHTVKTNINGLAYLTIGNGTILNGVITGIDWSKGPYFIKSETDPTGGKNYSIIVVSQILSAPYAIYANTAEKLTVPLSETDPVFNGSIAKGITATDTSYWNKKLNSSDTSGMLVNYKTGLNQKLNISDTSKMLLPYLREADTTNILSNYRTSINNKLDAKDTTLMLSYYLKKSERLNEIDPTFSSSIAKGINATDTSYWNKKLNITDTIGMLENYIKKEIFPQNPKNGDILFYYSNKWVNLEKGKNGQVLTLIDDLPKWSGMAYPSITTNIVSNITTTTATSGGNISSDGAAAVSARGVVWSTSPTPTISLSTKTSDGSGTGSFTSSLTGLSPSTTYYVRAFATNSAGTGYGNEITFTTSTPAVLPTVSTISASSITITSATSGGNITADGGAAVTTRGVVWSTSSSPTVSLSTKTSNGSGIGSFSSAITGLSPSTTYYVRAFATNSAGTGYGNEITFTTSSSVVPTVSTISASSITITSATSGGNITADGGAAVTTRGGVWSTSSSPTVSLSTKTSNGSGIGSFSSAITGLSPNTTYYVRSYATNSVGTGYGNEITFTSSSQLISDMDGNTYNAVSIGTQIWMNENLKTTKYRNGSTIPNIVANSDWQSLTYGAWSYYDNNVSNNAVYGKLYNWYATQGDSLCPLGWHVPSDAEWTILTTYLGGDKIVGGKLKATGTTYWVSPNLGATNESGFSSLPAGHRNYLGVFSERGTLSFFWNTTQNSISDAWVRYIYNTTIDVYRYRNHKTAGASVRCIKN